MYEIKPLTLKDFVEDNKIKLPRFQRKSTWSVQQNFELALSVFKKYPLGASILSKETDQNGNDVLYLLDGRQRSNALNIIYNNPEALFEWACKRIGAKSNSTINEITDKFWKYVNEYTNYEKDGDDKNDEIEETIESGEGDSTPQRGIDNLSKLLDLITIGIQYNQKGYKSGITHCFDFREYLQSNPKLLSLYESDRKNINCRVLRSTIREYTNTYCVSNNLNACEFSSFLSFLETRFDFNDEKAKKKFTERIGTDFNTTQYKVIDLFKTIDNIFQEESIAAITTYGITATDSQKIFNLINTGGTQLSASEILSSRPKWNIEVKNLDSDTQNNIKKLYSKDLSIKTDNFVKWDIPASLVYSLEPNIEKFFSIRPDISDSQQVGKRITLGFKLLSGFYLKGVKKEDIDSLADSKAEFDWSNPEEKLDEIKKFFSILSDNKHISNLFTWSKSLSDIISDGPTINFLVILFRKWLSLEKPANDTTNMKIFDKCVFIMLDNMVYEYICSSWKGSSDSIIQKNIKSYVNDTNIFQPLDSSSWMKLIEEIKEKYTIHSRPISSGSLDALVYYYYLLKGINGPADKENPGEVDHIYPQASWNSSAITNGEQKMNSFVNLGILPKNYNCGKKDRTLNELKLKPSSEAISKYEEISKNDFEKFSQLENFDELARIKFELYKGVFDSDGLRSKYLKNSF
jgi:hypothetical protein